MFIKDIDIEKNRDFDLLYRAISIETMSSPMSMDTISRIRGLMDSTISKIRDALSNFNIIDPLNYPTKEFNKYLKNNRYESLLDVDVYRPTGMTAGYLDAVKLLTEHHDEVVSINERLLIPFIKWAAEAITYPSNLQNLTDNKTLKMIDVDLINDRLDSLYNLEDKSDKAPYSAMIKRNSDWPVIVKGLRTLVNRQNKLKPGKLRESVDSASSHIDTIIKNCLRYPNKYDCSKHSRAKMADLLYAMGREVSLVSRYHWAVSSLTISIEDTVEKLLKAA